MQLTVHSKDSLFKKHGDANFENRMIRFVTPQEFRTPEVALTLREERMGLKQLKP